MGCCDPKRRPGYFNPNRHCTDLLFLLLYVAATAGIIYLVIRAVGDGGNPYKILRAVDMDGEICGFGNMSGKPYGAWPYPLFYDTQICVANCSETNRLYEDGNDYMAWRYESMAFVYYCLPTAQSNSSFLSSSSSSSSQTNGTNSTSDIDEFDRLVGLNFSSSFEASERFFSRNLADIQAAGQVEFGSILIALAFSFLFIFLLRFIAGFLIWLCIALILAAGILMGYYVFEFSEQMQADQTWTPDQVKYTRWTAIAIWIVTGLFFLIIVFLRKEIRIAIEIIKESATALNDIKSLVFFPLFPLFLSLLYFGGWIVAGLYIMSVTHPLTQHTPHAVTTYGYGFDYNLTSNQVQNALPSNYTINQIDTTYRYWGIAHLFHMFWTIQIFYYFTYLVIAGTIASWYFVKRDPSNDRKPRGSGDGEVPYSPVCYSCCRTCRYHLGTVIFASFFIAIIQMLRAIVFYLEEKIIVRRPNACQRALACCLNCFLKCMQCCCDKINKSALVWTAVYGDSLIPSACGAFDLLWNNLNRVAALTGISTILLTIGKYAIAISTACICGYLLTHLNPYKYEISSPIAPMIVCFLIGYIVAQLFMLLFEAIIDSTFLFFLIDLDKNGNNMFASKGLQSLVGKFKQQSEKRANEIRQMRAKEAHANIEMNQV